MSIRLALADAAKNCSERGAMATITLKSGVQYEGKLDKSSSANEPTAHLSLADGGWITIDIDEIAAAGAKP